MSDLSKDNTSLCPRDGSDIFFIIWSVSVSTGLGLMNSVSNACFMNDITLPLLVFSTYLMQFYCVPTSQVTRKMRILQ